MFDIVSDCTLKKKLYVIVDPEIFDENKPGITIEKVGFKTIEEAKSALNQLKSEDTAI